MRKPPHAFSYLVPLVLCLLVSIGGRSQTPFSTDDVDVTGRGKFHFEFANDFDVLNAEAFPTLKQNTSDFTLAYGLARNMEASIESPFITLIVDDTNRLRYISGIGDTAVAVKYNFYRERKGSRLPSLAASFNLEFPTGKVSKGLGSGLNDYFLNVIAQKSLTSRTTWRVNGGVLFAGDTTTGAIGIRGRGTIFAGGTSIVRQVNERLDLGGEITGALARKFTQTRGQLQVKAGGNYLLSNKLSLDFAVVAGRFVASPRLGARLGFSFDF